jgi:cell wall-associated NlpC family hydrolase
VLLACAALALSVVPQTSSASPAPTIDQVQAQLAALATQGEVAQERLNQVRVDIAATERVLAQRRAKVARSQAEVSVAQSTVDQIAAAQYRDGGIDPTVQVLLADSPDQFLAQLGAVQVVSQRQADVLRTAAVARQRLDQDKLAAAQQLAALRTLFAQSTQAYQQVQAAQAKATALLASLQAAQRAALAKAQAQARAQALAAAQAALAQARADAAQAAAAAAARARAAAAKARTTTTKTSTKTTTKRTVTHPPRHRSPSPPPPTPSSSSIGQRVVDYALARVGDAYVWGAAGPRAYDCSGLTMRAYQSVGISLPHSSSAQYGYGRHISASALQPGDLVFYYSPIHHVGIYIGHGMIVNAENPSVGVTVAPLYSMPYVGAVRPY